VTGKGERLSLFLFARTFAYWLTRDAMRAMKAQDPALAIAFNELIRQVIAERLVATNREVLALNR
jgi:hypothetical protein